LPMKVSLGNIKQSQSGNCSLNRKDLIRKWVKDESQ
jgi:hypothetical protein